MADEDPSGGLFGGFDPKALENVPLFRELSKLLSWRGGPVNWELARQLATGLVGPVRPGIGTDADAADFAQAVSAAELWLDPVTALPAKPGPVVALTPQEWVRRAATSSGLGIYVEPVANGMRTALGRGLTGMVPEAEGLAGMLGGAMEPLGAMLSGMQSGAIAGHLATELLGTYDLGVPTVEPTVVGQVGDAAARFASDYGLDPAEVRYWLALREALHRRLYAGVPWLRGELVALVGAFAAEADFDPGAIMQQLGGAGLSPERLGDPDAVRELLEGAEAFAVQPTPAQQEVLARFQALIGFVAGYSEVVVATAGERLTALPRIAEAALRRQAERSAGERFLQQLTGLDLKPSDARQGGAFCRAVVAARGQAGLDRAWVAADRLPNPQELADPSRWLVRMAALEIADDLEPEA